MLIYVKMDNAKDLPWMANQAKAAKAEAPRIGLEGVEEQAIRTGRGVAVTEAKVPILVGWR